MLVNEFFKCTSMKFVYKNEKHKDIVIYHDSDSDSIKKYLLSGLNKSIIIIDPFVINLNFRIFLSFIKNIFKIKRGIPYKRFTFMVYQYSYIEFLKPKVVVTFNDNSMIFHWLAINYVDANFYAIQNGSRVRYDLYYHYYQITTYTLTNFFCFGDYEVEKYIEYGHYVKNFIPVGSFRFAMYRDKYRNTNISKKYDIALVSQNKPTTFDGSNAKLKENLELIDQYLSSFLRKNRQLSFIILCRSERDSIVGKQEKQYFRSVYGDKVDLRFFDDMPSSTYTGIDQSDLIICCCSTALMEAAGAGKKVLFCDYSGDKIWADYPSGIWLHTEKSSVSFNNHVQRAITSRESDYDEFANYIMKSSDSTINIMKREIESNFN